MDPYREWAPSNISRKPVPDGGTSPYHSPTAPQTPWMGHSTTFFTQPGRSDTGYPSSIWEPVHQTRPPSRRANDSHTGLLRTASPDLPPRSLEGPRGTGWLRRHWTPAWSMYAFLRKELIFLTLILRHGQQDRVEVSRTNAKYASKDRGMSGLRFVKQDRVDI